MAKKTNVEVEVEVVDEATEKVGNPAKGEVTVIWRGGSRVYSKELHGADFKDLAAEFAEKKGGKVV